MDVPGFTLLLQDFCAYCADFEVEVESFNYTELSGLPKSVHDIRCKHRKRCETIAENLKAKCKDE